MIFARFFLLLTVFACSPLAIFSMDVNPLDYGAVADDGLDDTAAIQAAVNATLSKGGGTVTFPTGKLNLASTISLVPANYVGGEVKLSGSRGSIVEVSVGSQGFAIYAGNLNAFTIEDVIFVGKNVTAGDPSFYDARYVIFSNFVNQTNLIRTQFFGLATPSDGAVVYFGNTDGKVADCQFDGSLGQFPNGAVVLADNARGLTVTRSTFLDYANTAAGYISKTPSFTGSWVKVIGSLAATANGTRRTVIEDNRFDEGAATAVWIEGVQWASISGNSINVNATSEGRGFFLKDMVFVEIKQSWFGYTAESRPAIDVLNVGAIEVTALNFGGGVYFMRKRNLTNLSVKFCIPCGGGMRAF